MKYSPSNAENVFVCHSTVGQEVGHQGRYQQKHDGKVDNCESNGPSFRKCVVFTVAKKREKKKKLLLVMAESAGRIVS
jgi:hypothetical protein